MSRKNRRTQAAASNVTPLHRPVDSSPENRAATSDNFANFAARMGQNASNLNGGAVYTPGQNRTRDYTQLENMYRTSWVIRKGIDGIADDMTREGVEFHTESDPTELSSLQEDMERLGIWDALGNGVRYGRLYGGAISVMLIDGQDMATPLNLDSIKQDQFKGLYVLDRWQLQAPINNMVVEFGPDLGKPLSYTVLTDGNPLGGRIIHHSRVIRHPGASLPYRQRYKEQGWDASFIEVWFDRIVAFDTATAGAAQLIHKAHLRTIGIKGLRQILALGDQKMKDGLYAQVEFMRLCQTIEGLTLMDGEDQFEANSYSFAGLDSMLQQFSQQVAAAMDYPIVRLFGQSPGGLNATGDTDMDMYKAKIKQDQEKSLRPGLTTLMQVQYRSSLGVAPDDSFSFEFRPIDPLKETEKSEIFSKDSKAIMDLATSGIIMRPTALKELKQLGDLTGRGTNITDEDIRDAENDPPLIQTADPNDPANPPQEDEPKP